MFKKSLFLALTFLTILCAETYQAKDYSYLVGRVKGLDPALLNMHFKLYQGYVKNTNTLVSILETMRARGEDRTPQFGALKRRFGWEYDGMVLHELYFSNLGGGASLPKSSTLYREITQNFGSYAAWAQDFKATGLIRGIGWVVLYKDPIEGRLYNIWVNEHNVNHLAGGTPILVMDVWEHAYLTEFGLDRGKYIDVFMENIDWDIAIRRLPPSGNAGK